MTTPETRYAKSGDVHIAYQVVGDGPRDLVLVPGWVSHLEYEWEEPCLLRFLRRLASFSRLILLDRRGTGLSDRVSALPSLEQRMDDVRAVMDAAAIRASGDRRHIRERPHGHDVRGDLSPSGCPHSFCVRRSSGLPRLQTIRSAFRLRSSSCSSNGCGSHGAKAQLSMDSLRVSPATRTFARLGSHGAVRGEPAGFEALDALAKETDARGILAAIRVPTLVVHRAGDLVVRSGQARYLAERIAGAKLAEIPGIDHFPWAGDDAMVDEIEEFLTGTRHAVESDRVLATMLFSDIVGSTEHAAKIGDRRWRGVLEGICPSFGASSLSFAGERSTRRATACSPLSTDPRVPSVAPARSARASRSSASRFAQGCIRANARSSATRSVASPCIPAPASRPRREPNEVLVSATVKDLVAGSGIAFEPRGVHALKGVPGGMVALRRVVRRGAIAPGRSGD